jgi:Cu-processing system permease protein
VNAIRTIARLEFAAATRQRWVRVFAIAFALLSVAIAASAGGREELGGLEGFARTTVALVPLALLLVPLVALLLSVSGQAGEPGSEAFLLAQPVTRFEVLLGKWAGELAALGAALGAGLGAGGLFLAANAGFEGFGRFLFFVAVSAALGAAFVSIGAAISAACGRRMAALGIAAFVWFSFALLYDGAALAIAGFVPGRTGARILFGSVFGNPADLARILALTVSGSPHILGAAGESWTRLLGGPVSAPLFAAAGLAAWIAVPLAFARRSAERRDY